MTDQAAEQTTTGGISDRIVFLVLGSLLTLAIIVSLIAFFDFGRWWVFGNPNFAPWLDGFFQNAGTEFLGALLTFYLIETLLRKRRAEDERKDREQLQARLDEDEERRTEELKELQHGVAKEIRDELRGYIQAQELARLRAAETPEERQSILDSMKATGLLAGANLRDANLVGAFLYQANLEGANLINAKLEGANLINAKLEAARLKDTNLERADLRKTNLERANLQRAALENANLQEAFLERANLQGVDLRLANLEEAYLWEANLEGADLESANLEGAVLYRANLEGADLRDANLEGARLSDANLEKADLRDANLEGSNLNEANLEGALLLTVAQLRSAETLKGATLPDGTKLPNDNTWQQAFEHWVEHTAQLKEIDMPFGKDIYIVPTHTEANAELWDALYR